MQVEDRPAVVQARVHKIVTGCGNLYVTVGHTGGEGTPEYRLIEVFATMGETGGCSTALLEGLTRMVSIALRSGIPEERIIRMLNKVHCPQPFYGNTHLGNGQSKSCVHAIARVMQLELSLRKEPDENTDTTGTIGREGKEPRRGH